MRRTESAQEMFQGAHDMFQWTGSDPRQPSQLDAQNWLAGMRAIAIGLGDLAAAIRDVYDKLESVYPRGRIVGTLERIPPRH